MNEMKDSLLKKMNEMSDSRQEITDSQTALIKEKKHHIAMLEQHNKDLERLKMGFEDVQSREMAFEEDMRSREMALLYVKDLEDELAEFKKPKQKKKRKRQH